MLIRLIGRYINVTSIKVIGDQDMINEQEDTIESIALELSQLPNWTYFEALMHTSALYSGCY
jgi:hypothetical protein